MATLVTCDKCDEAGTDNVRADWRVRATTLKNSTVETVFSMDTCNDHLGDVAAEVSKAHLGATNFYEVVIQPYGV